MAALLSNSADIALIGPEAAIYVLNSDSSIKARIFCGLTSTDGFMLVGRKKVDKFDWGMLKGKEILGFRPGSTPLLFLEEAMRHERHRSGQGRQALEQCRHARRGSVHGLPGQNQYAIFIEPDASQLELDGKAYFLASIGATVGFADYTSFMATDKYIKDNRRDRAELDRRHLPGAEMDGRGVRGGDRQRDRGLLPGRQSAGADLGGRTLSKAEDLEDARR